MTVKLNGWLRLWVVLSVVSITPFGYFVFSNLATAVDIPHDDAYYLRLNDEDRKKLIIKPNNTIGNSDVHSATSVSIPNGHTLHFDKDYNVAAIEQVSNHYFDILKEESKRRNLSLVLSNILAWLSINILIYAVGYGIAWVISGFKQRF